MSERWKEKRASLLLVGAEQWASDPTYTCSANITLLLPITGCAENTLC